MKKAVIFDIDGTMWDVTELMTEVWNRCCPGFGSEERAAITRDEIKGVMGKTMDQIGEELFPELPLEESREIIKKCSDEEEKELAVRGGLLYPGLEDCFKTLISSGLHLYIVSNGQANYAKAFVSVNHFEDYFEDAETFGRTGRQKGENIRLLMERNGIERAVYVGDTLMDEQAARFAGTDFIWASYGFGRAGHPDAVIARPDELPGAVQRMFEK